MQDLFKSLIHQELQSLLGQTQPQPQEQKPSVEVPKVEEEVTSSSSSVPVDIDSKIRLCNKIYKNDKMPDHMKEAIVGKILKDIGFEMPEPAVETSKKRTQRSTEEEPADRPSIRRQKTQAKQPSLTKKPAPVDELSDQDEETPSLQSSVDVSALISSLGE